MRRLGLQVSKRWWEQEDIYLEWIWEEARMAGTERNWGKRAGEEEEGETEK